MKLVTVTLNTSVDRTLEVPRFCVGGHLKGRLVRAQPAGKGVNVSRCLGAMGVPSVVTGFVGLREAPLFADSFAGTPASVELVPVAEPTRTNTTILDPELGTDTHIREAGFHVSESEVAQLRGRLGQLASAETLFVFCGSCPPGLGRAQLASLFAACRSSGAQLAADLNGADLPAAVEASASLIKPNVEELGDLVGTDLANASTEQLAEAASSLLGNVGTVLVTRGSQGALAVNRSGVIEARTAPCKARNTVGCGDAFLAGYLAGIARGRSAEECLRLAVACGAASARTDAAGQIDPEAVTAIEKTATVRRVR